MFAAVDNNTLGTEFTYTTIQNKNFLAKQRNMFSWTGISKSNASSRKLNGQISAAHNIQVSLSR